MSEVKHVDASQEYSRVVMAGDADESCQADSFCLDECFNGSFRAEYLFNVSFGPDVVNLPQVQMIRFHVHQRLGKMSQSPLLIASM